jgi:pimeloyl-ACP methyl ester carboxylesterase
VWAGQRAEAPAVASAAVVRREGFASSSGGRVHWVLHAPERPEDERGAPVVLVPGWGERAEEWEALLAALAPRAAVAVSVRGRGQSDAPASGYAWQDHVDDVAAVVDHLGWARTALVGFSRGSSYALGYALRRPETVPVLVIGDYQARHVGLPASWVDDTLRTTWRGVPMDERVTRAVVEGVQRDSVEVPLWDRLTAAPFRLHVIRAGRKAVVDDAAVERYRAARPDMTFTVLADANHDLWGRDPAGFTAAVRAALDDAAPPEPLA